MKVTNADYKSVLLTLSEEFDDERKLDEEDVEYLFGIIELLEKKNELYETIIREGRHIVSD